MSLWILDTDTVSLFQRQHPIIRQRVSAANPQEIAVTVVTVEEQFYGRLNQIKRAKSADNLIFAYASLKATVDYFLTVNLLDFDRDAYNCCTDLMSQKIRVGTQDLRIAAIAISQNAILVTRNRRDFERIPGLQWEDWTVE